MEVRRVPNQAGGTLREFYAGYATGPGGPGEKIGRRMLALLDRLADADGPPLWGLTSHASLHLFIETDGPTALVHGHGAGYVVESYGVGVAGGGNAADAAQAVALVLGALRASRVPLAANAPDAEPGAAADPIR